MRVSPERLEAFSDGVMAIAITLMAFGIPLPEQFDRAGVLSLLVAVGVFLVSFLLVGAQWVKHCWLLRLCKTVTNKLMGYNILYLFCLSLLPLFTKWIMLHPGEVVPAVGYDIVFLLLTICYQLLRRCAMAQLPAAMQRRRRRGDERFDRLFFPGFVGGGAAIFALSLLLPTLSIVFFIAWPVLSSLLLLVRDERSFVQSMSEPAGARRLPPFRAADN